MKSIMQSLLSQFPYSRRLFKDRERLRVEQETLLNQLQQYEEDFHLRGRQIQDLLQHIERQESELQKRRLNQFYTPGHYYSPLPDVEDLRKRADQVFPPLTRSLPGIDLNEAAQLALLDQLQRYYAELPFPEEPTPGFRYYYQNSYYRHSDAIFLYALLRHLKPQRYIEVGSGFTSALALDTNERFFNNSISCSFIEPYPERLYELLKPGERDRLEIHITPLQEIPLEFFSRLQPNDILLIDSTHVVKTGGDVNYLFFQILPILSPGVYIHFHDIWYPFEYPEKWIYDGWGWNETYFLRAFLQYNTVFKIVLFNTFLEHFHAAWFEQFMPHCLNSWGGCVWLQKVSV